MLSALILLKMTITKMFMEGKKMTRILLQTLMTK